MITIFANLRINEPERLQHMKDSFRSFNEISDDWLINIRGKLRDEAIAFLKENLGDKMTLFELLDDSKGWITNALEMLLKAKYDYVFVWNEDHINIAPQDYVKNVIKEMIKEKADYLLPSYYPFWKEKFGQVYDEGIIKRGNYIDVVNITKKNISQFFPEPEKRECIITGAAIFRKNFLKKIMEMEQYKLPMVFTRYLYRIMTGLNMAGIKFNQRRGFDFVNKFFIYKLGRFSKETPFELEITNDRHYVLPFRLAFAKKELLACIDDDLAVNGYQLVKRGLYPPDPDLKIDIGQKETTPWGNKEMLEQNDSYTIERCFISKDKSFSERYYEDEIRTKTLMSKTIVVINGRLSVEAKSRQLELTSGQSVTIFPNIGFNLRAIEDSLFVAIFSSIHNKKIKYANPN